MDDKKKMWKAIYDIYVHLSIISSRKPHKKKKEKGKKKKRHLVVNQKNSYLIKLIQMAGRLVSTKSTNTHQKNKNKKLECNFLPILVNLGTHMQNT